MRTRIASINGEQYRIEYYKGGDFVTISHQLPDGTWDPLPADTAQAEVTLALGKGWSKSARWQNQYQWAVRYEQRYGVSDEKAFEATVDGQQYRVELTCAYANVYARLSCGWTKLAVGPEQARVTLSIGEKAHPSEQWANQCRWARVELGE